MGLISYTINDLKKELDSPGKLLDGPIVPITRQRLISAVNNPLSTPEDTVLIIGYDDSHNIVSYIMLFPDVINTGSGHCRFAWLSSWWADSEKRNTGIIAATVYFKALSLYGGRIGVTAMANISYEIIRASRRFPISLCKKGFVGYFHLDSATFLAKRPRLRMLSFPASVCSSILNIYTNVRYHKWKKSVLDKYDFNIKYVLEIDPLLSEFISKFASDGIFDRGGEGINWILRNKWIIESVLEDDFDKKYFFSNSARQFKYYAFKLYTDNKLIAFVLLKVRDESASVPYVFFYPEYAPLVTSVILSHLAELKVRAFEVFHDGLCECIMADSRPFIMIKPTERMYLFTERNRDVNFTTSKIQDGDGDTVFF